LARNPGFALVGTLTLALGMGGTVAIYAVVDSVILNPLPYPESDELVWMDNAGPGIDASEGLGFTTGLVYHISRHQHTMTALGAYSAGAVTVTGDGDPERVRMTLATPSLGEVLSVPLERGRWFLEGDGGPPATGPLERGPGSVRVTGNHESFVPPAHSQGVEGEESEKSFFMKIFQISFFLTLKH